jgi:hypothetical protein
VPVWNVEVSERPGSREFRMRASGPIQVSMRERRGVRARPEAIAAPRASAYNSISAGVSLLLLGAMLAQMVLALPLPTWLGSVMAGILLASLLGWLGRPTTPPSDPSIELGRTPAPCVPPRHVGLCRGHRTGRAEWTVPGGLEPADSMSPWFQLW